MEEDSQGWMLPGERGLKLRGGEEGPAEMRGGQKRGEGGPAAPPAPASLTWGLAGWRADGRWGGHRGW